VSVASFVATAMTAATPLAYAALGETVAERAGVLNLGVEGMMLAGAVAGFGATLGTGSHWLGVAAGAGAGAGLASLFALLTLGLGTNQVATGLALTIFGTGVSTLAGQGLTGRTVAGLPKLGLVQGVPVVGTVLHQDALVFAAVGMAGAIAFVVGGTRLGRVLRAVGEDARAAHRLGLPVLPVRLGCVLFGGAMAGVGGAYLSIAYTPLWAEGMVAGRGWIALALVVFGSWRAWRVLAGAALFGALEVGQLSVGGGWHVPNQLWATLPYLATIVVLAAISSRRAGRGGAPADLGRPFRAGG
jgi:simple sugar transport system permease protein